MSNATEVTNMTSDTFPNPDDIKALEFREKISDVMSKYEKTREIKIRAKRVTKYEPAKMVWCGCILYYRRSTDMQDTTIESQQTDCVKKANELNLPILKEYVDEISGKTEIHEREGLSKLLEIIQPGQVLIVYSISRIARQIDVFYGIMKILKERGCRVICCHEKLDSIDPYMEVIWAIHASFAQMEREAISSRTKRALETLKRNGINVGRPKWGYIVDKDTKKLVPDPLTQDIIKWMINVRTEKKYSLEDIAGMLNELDIPSLSGKCGWNRRMVSTVLRREMGEEEAKKHKLSKFINNRKNEKDLVNEDVEFIKSINNPQENKEKDINISQEDVINNELEINHTSQEQTEISLPNSTSKTTELESTSSSSQSRREQLMKRQLPYLKIMVQRKYKDMFTEEQLRDISIEELVDLLDE
jgi:DNA invertase Pin-like site-specific DNA recombinase